MNNTLVIKVRYASQAYNTNRIHGCSSSSTSSPESAARGLAKKLYGPSLIDVRRLCELGVHSEWEATADADENAWCWADGTIEFGVQIPAGAFRFACGPSRALRTHLQAVAHLGNKGLAVPGSFESYDQGIDALLAFTEACSKSNGKPGSFNVVFGTTQLAKAA